MFSGCCICYNRSRRWPGLDATCWGDKGYTRSGTFNKTSCQTLPHECRCIDRPLTILCHLSDYLINTLV